MCGIAGLVDWRAATPVDALRTISAAMIETVRHRGPDAGEIYNYRDIRRELEAAGRAMRSDSDTEVLLEACALWGVEAALERTIGMFAFALWDRSARTLHLARDRLGIKPLY